MTTTTSPHTVPRVTTMRTGLLRTEVLRRPDGTHQWVRTLGPAAELPFSDPGILRPGPHATAVADGGADPDRRIYEVPGAGQLINLLVTGSDSALTACGAAWAQALRHIHDTGTGAGEVAPARPLRRAQLILDAGQGWFAPAARQHLGSAHLARLQQWLQDAGRAEHLVHGSPGMAHWILGEHPGEHRLLLGEDTGTGPIGHDLSWIRGELAELWLGYPRARPALEKLWSSFAATYGADAQNTEALDEGAALRLLLHAHDTCAHAGAPPAHARHLIDFARQILTGAWR